MVDCGNKYPQPDCQAFFISSLTRIRLYCDFQKKLGRFWQILKANADIAPSLSAYIGSPPQTFGLHRRYCALAQNLAYTHHYAITTVHSVVLAYVSVVRSYLRRVQSYDISAVVAIFVFFILRPRYYLA
jgi:hypothetical protein